MPTVQARHPRRLVLRIPSHSKVIGRCRHLASLGELVKLHKSLQTNGFTDGRGTVHRQGAATRKTGRSRGARREGDAMTHRLPFVLVAGALLLMAGPAIAQQDVEGGRDYPAFTRMPGFYISEYKDSPFASYEFRIGEKQNQTVEGRYIKIWYRAEKGVTPPSPLQIMRNVEEATRSVGGTVVWDNGKTQATMKQTYQGNELWFQVIAPIGGIQSYTLHIVERQAMKQDVTANADAWISDISSAGHATVYGINLDTDKAEIKPESEPALGEIAKLLTSNPTLSVYIVGHTDNAGAYEHNMKLSQERAAAVVAALVGRHGIGASRLMAVGVGPVAPVASNDTDEGRAKNRRVELVKR
jgi:OOP family OmpA-OmpF porin